MSARTFPRSTPLLPRALALVAALSLTACDGGGDPTGPTDSPTPPPQQPPPPPPPEQPVEELPVTDVTRGELEPKGKVTETSDGYRVEGALTVKLGDARSVTLANADLVVRFDSQNRVRSISGKAEIPSPHERIRFEDPVRADVGFFPGKWLNEKRDLGLTLREDTEYFVYDFQTQLKMSIATGETGADATRPVWVKAPVGGRVLMVIDYTDPMYYVYGEQDLIGSLGTGWSLNKRIPFRPTHAVPELKGGGSFEGGAVRVGSFPVYKVFTVSGLAVDNSYRELHMNTQDPLASEARQGYRMGHNGSMEFDLAMRDMVGITLPVASASGGIWYEARTDGTLLGHAYAAGSTGRDFSWWPQFIPLKPASHLATESYVSSDGGFKVELQGTYGWEFPGEQQSLTGVFSLANDGMTVEGITDSNGVIFKIGAHVTTASTRAYFDPPAELTDEIAGEVNRQVLPRIEEAEKAWNDLQKATGDYELELSLRGIRTQIPPMVDAGTRYLREGIDAAIRSQKGKIWEKQFRQQILAADDVYYAKLAQLKAAAQNANDNDATRATIERALRELAAHKVFTFNFSYRVLGQTVYSTTYTRRILSDEQASMLLRAADNVHRIKETSDLKIKLQSVYDTVNERALFEQVRDDLENGVLKMRPFEEMGFVIPHQGDFRAELYVRIDGKSYQSGTITALDIEQMVEGLSEAMIEALKTN